MASRTYDVTVIVEKYKFEESIRTWLDKHGEQKHLTFEFLPEKLWAPAMWSIGLGYTSYRWWLQRAFFRAQAMHATEPFDCVHMSTIIGFREPGSWYQLGIPLIWGPIGGTHSYPRQFLGEAGLGGGLKERVRSLVNRWQLKHRRRVRTSLREATRVVAASTEARSDLQRVVDRPIDVVSEITVDGMTSQDPIEISHCREKVEDGLRIVWSGLFETRKCLSLLIKAVARVPSTVPLKVRVVGDGGERDRWQELSRQLGVADRFEWLGWVPYSEARKQLRWADVFAFTSVRETTGTVIIEALDAGLPVITLDHQGARDAITDDCGMRVPTNSVEDAVVAFANALILLARDNELRQVLSDGALRRAREYHIDTKTEVWKTIWSAAIAPKSAESKERKSSRTHSKPASLVGEVRE